MSTNKTPARKLTRAERKQIDAAIARAKRQDKRKKSAQDSIPFQRMYPDGVCRVTDNYYTKTVQFQDINYQLNQNEDKTAIFDGWCDFLNYFDSSIRFQLSFINLSATRDTYARRIAIPLQGDCFDKLRTEYTGMLQSQLARGNNGLIKTKYLTFGVEADSLKAAKPRLERIETDILNNFRRLGVQAEALNGMERLRLLHGMLHMDEPQPFRFSWDWLAPSGLSVKDFIAPSAFEFKTGSSFGVGSKTGCVSFLQILAPELNDRMLADFLDMESSLIVSMHVQSVDQVKAIKTIKRKITDLQKMTIEEQKKAVRSGYDMDIIPSDLATYGTEAKKLLQELQSRNERMFLLTFLVVNVADNRQRLGNNVFQAGSLITDIDRHYAEICKERGLDKETESLAAQPVQEIAVQEPEPVTAPDNGCVPDPAISVESMNAYGYTDSNMLPLTKERALELMERDVSVYMLHTDNTEAMAFDAEDIRSFDGVFGVEASEWETVKDRLTPPDYEKAFLDNTADSFAIYQLRDNDNTAQLRFMNAEYLEKKGLSIEKGNYAAVYAGNLDRRGDTQDRLDVLYETFNLRRPEDFRGHSLSVSDIVALKQNGVVSCHYVDSRGFKALPDFLKPENYLKNAEMTMEDDYGMIDGVINNGPKQTVAELEEQAKSGKPVSLMELAQAARREQAQAARQEKKPSVLAKLCPPVNEPKKTARSKRAERELL